MRPSVREIQRHAADYPDWALCPVCHGGRGELVPRYEDENPLPVDYVVRECSLCHGDRVIQRVSVGAVDAG